MKKMFIVVLLLRKGKVGTAWQPCNNEAVSLAIKVFLTTPLLVTFIFYCLSFLQSAILMAFSIIAQKVMHPDWLSFGCRHEVVRTREHSARL
jgi:hypothetical protein